MSDTIKVIHKFVDGAHFFVSDDKEAAGLCVAHPDLKTAFDEVAKQLNTLFEFNYGEKCDFQAGVPFENFKSAVEASRLVAKGADQSGMIVSATIQPWMCDRKVNA